MTDVQATLTRKLAIANNTDPFGKVWGVVLVKGTALYRICNVNDENEAKIPASYPDVSLSGLFTKTDLAEKAVKGYLDKAWDKNDDAVLKAAGKKRAKEAQVEEETRAA